MLKTAGAVMKHVQQKPVLKYQVEEPGRWQREEQMCIRDRANSAHQNRFQLQNRDS